VTLLAVASTMALTLSLSACGGGDSDGDAGSGSSASAPSSSGPADVPFTGSVENGLPKGYPEPKPEKRKLAFLTVVAANEFMKGVGDAMAHETKKLGGTLTVFDAKLDADTQVTQFQQALAQGYDGLFVNAADNKALAPVLAQAEKLGIPVIGLDTTQSATELEGFTSQIWESREEQAYLQVKELARHVDKGAPIAQISSGVPVPVVQVFSEYERKWAKAFGLDMVSNTQSGGDGIPDGEKAMTGLLAKHPDIQGLLPYNDPNGIGAGAAARAQGKKDFPIVGTNGGSDALAAIKSGRLTATVKIDAVSIGRYAAMGLYAAAAGDKLPPTVLSGKPIVVTKDNVDEVKSWQDEIAALPAG
jgi:ABC-type sugar transport system substrate-binding protein